MLQLPGVGDKTFLISIGDRTVTGLVARDQMVGPWQVPVADVAVSLSGFEANSGEDLTDYNLRRIGSDLEHLVRSLLQKGSISYNISARVNNYSMGLPRVAGSSGN